ncbi:MAG: hypothetical protein Q8910_04260 [Bacteroidota bacterium]|nr:hypothetical protein [Bacteroidota bacterium]
MSTEGVIKFYYRNWKGEKSVRQVKPSVEIWWGHTEYHKVDQWLMRAYDLEKGDYRDFAMRDIERFL